MTTLLTMAHLLLTSCDSKVKLNA